LPGHLARGFSQRAAGATRTEPPAIAASLRELDTLLSRVPGTSAAIAFDLPRAQLALSRLRALSTAWPAASPADYRANLANDVSVLAAALTAGTANRLSATVQAIADDLEIKLEHCTRSGGKLGGSVVVRVRTLQGSDEIKNWQVLYMPRVLEAAGQVSPERFPQVSSPTEDLLVPGRYVMWLRNPSTNRVSERTTVKIGEGRKELLLDLPVPADPSR